MYRWLYKSILIFFVTLLTLVIIKWALFEPYMIPSGSMKPTLLVNDYILVDKKAYGIRVPFTSSWLIRFNSPKRAEVVVFRSVSEPDYIMIKRIVGVAGDKISINKNGQVFVNTRPESSIANIMLDQGLVRDPFNITVTKGHVFVMGDNRDNSHDSRYWGELPVENLLGRAKLIWLSCQKTIDSGFCDISSLRWERVLKEIR